MTAKTVKDAVTVPTTAVFKNAEGADYILLAGSDEKAHQKVVQLGVRNSERTQIASGINAGDSVITTGGYAVADGTAIKIEKAGAGESDAADKADDKDKKDDKKDHQKDGKPAATPKPAAKGKE